jgi:uncharacterized SAM-binding protein YcdF (DUF218 family)
VTALLLGVTAGWWLPGIGHWLAVPPRPGPADAIAVHGGSYEGDYDRTLYSFVLYWQGLAPKLWNTGYAIRERAVTELAHQHGIPPGDFNYLVTNSSWEDGQEIAAMAKRQRVRSILIVTDWWHSRRALCADQLHLVGSQVNVYYKPVQDSPFTPDNWWRSEDGRVLVLSELVKFGYYWVRYGMAPWRC